MYESLRAARRAFSLEDLGQDAIEDFFFNNAMKLLHEGF